MKTIRQRNLTIQHLRPGDFAPSKVVPTHVRSLLLASLGPWKVKHVIWKAGTKYPDHTLKAEAFVYVTKGRLTVRNRTIGPGTLAHFKRGFAHRNYGSKPGGEFILIWRGPQTAKYI